MAGSGQGRRGRAGAAEAAGRRIGAELGLGEYLRAEDRSKSRVQGMVTAIVLLIVLPWYGAVGGGLTMMVSGPDSFESRVISGGVVLAIGLGIGTPLIAMLLHGMRDWHWFYTYEGGFAEVKRDRRVTVVRWADLASMSVSVTRGYDDEYVSGCVLRDHAGNAISVDTGLIGRAEQVLTGRLVGPLTARFDAGQPVTVGGLTVDRQGIRCHGGGRWDLSWRQVQGIDARLHGQRVTVRTGHRGGRHAAFDDQPNGFLAGYVLEHAARQAGVPFSAWSS